jgi:hypothetical protein
MTRVVKLIVALIIVVVALFFLSGVDSKKPLKPIEKPVENNEAV